MSEGPAGWLGLAASPTFAGMALLTGSLDGGRPDILCSAAPAGSALSGMAAMYLLMALMHAGAWLKLIGGRRS